MITREELNTKCHMIQSQRGHGDTMFFYVHRCVEHPRLTRYDLYQRSDRSVTSTWRVDGLPARDLADAIEKLNVPPVLTDDEKALLALVPTEWSGKTNDLTSLKLMTLTDKGCVEWDKGKFRRRVEC